MGNLVEAYDMSICYFLANELSKVLLGVHQNNPSIMLTLIFLAYLAKPIGSFLLGLLSDLYGRKLVLTMSVLIMGLSTASIGLIPGYTSIGLASAGILLTLRIIQSMALGSEFLNSASFLVESGEKNQKGFRGCWSSVGVKAGYLLACLITELTQGFATHTGYDWAWRIPFLLALVTTIAGAYIRYHMPESLDYVIYYAERKKPTTRSIYQQSKTFVKNHPFLFNYAFFASFLSVATGFFFYLYIPLHATQYSHLSHALVMTSTMLSLTFATVLIPIFGWISDRYDRLKMLTFACFGLFILSYPFMYAVNFGNAAFFFIMQLLISIPCACYYSVSSVILTELFPLQIRCTALSIIFSIAASLAAGAPPLIANTLVQTTHRPNSPCIIMMLLSFVVLINIYLLVRYYRVGINQYNTEAFVEDAPRIMIQYHKTVLE